MCGILGDVSAELNPSGVKNVPWLGNLIFVPRQTREMDIAGFDESGEGFEALDTLSAPAKLFGHGLQSSTLLSILGRSELQSSIGLSWGAIAQLDRATDF